MLGILEMELEDTPGHYHGSVRITIRYELSISPSKLPVTTLLAMIANYRAIYPIASLWPNPYY